MLSGRWSGHVPIFDFKDDFADLLPVSEAHPHLLTPDAAIEERRERRCVCDLPPVESVNSVSRLQPRPIRRPARQEPVDLQP
jgi:hypothetical protein